MLGSKAKSTRRHSPKRECSYATVSAPIAEVVSNGMLERPSPKPQRNIFTASGMTYMSSAGRSTCRRTNCSTVWNYSSAAFHQIADTRCFLSQDPDKLALPMSQRRSRANPTGSFGVSKGRFEERPHGRFCIKTLRIGRSDKQLLNPSAETGVQRERPRILSVSSTPLRELVRDAGQSGVRHPVSFWPPI